MTIILKKKKDKYFVPDSKMLDNLDDILDNLIESAQDGKIKHCI
jgi:hypothetical protein